MLLRECQVPSWFKVKRKELTVIDQIHQPGGCADSDAGLLALEERYLLLDLHVLCKLVAG